MRFAPARHRPFHAVGAALLAVACSTQEPPEARVSEFGRYEGYSEPMFEEWVNTARYVEMRDGVRLAVDVTFPAVNGEAAEGPFPVVWTHSRYHRNPGALNRIFAPEGVEVPEVHSQVDGRGDLQLLVRQRASHRHPQRVAGQSCAGRGRG